MGTRGKSTWTAAELRGRAKARLDAEARFRSLQKIHSAVSETATAIMQVRARGEVGRGARFCFTLPERT